METVEKVIETKRKTDIKFPYSEHKEVYIRRKKQQGAIPGQDPEEAIAKIGSSYAGSTPLQGLTYAEQKRFLPNIIGINSDSQNWEKSTRDYWASITKAIPSGDGLKLEVGMLYDNEEQYLYDREEATRDRNGTILESKGTPINLADYILWRYCLLYSHVANTIEDVGKSPKIRFYIHNKERDIQIRKVSQTLKRNASQEWYKRMGERDWVNHILYVLVSNDKSGKYNIAKLNGMNEDEKDLLVEELIADNPQYFLDVAKDVNLQMKSFIEECISKGELIRIANTSTITYQGNTLGNSLDGAVEFLKNSKNSQTLKELQARVKKLP